MAYAEAVAVIMAPFTDNGPVHAIPTSAPVVLYVSLEFALIVHSNLKSGERFKQLVVVLCLIPSSPCETT